MTQLTTNALSTYDVFHALLLINFPLEQDTIIPGLRGEDSASTDNQTQLSFNRISQNNHRDLIVQLGLCRLLVFIKCTLSHEGATRTRNTNAT